MYSYRIATDTMSHLFDFVLQIILRRRDVQVDTPRQFQMTDAEAEQAAEVENEAAESIRETQKTATTETVNGCAATQCPWCGFSDHIRKSRHDCPQHPTYCGTNHAKGAKVSDDWVPGNRKSHMKQQKRKLTPFSVRSAPSDITFTVEDWKEGPDALNGYVPPECTAPDMTRPNEAHGWTVDTPPIELFNYFYPVSNMLRINHAPILGNKIVCVLRSLNSVTNKSSGRTNTAPTLALEAPAAKIGLVLLQDRRWTTWL